MAEMARHRALALLTECTGDDIWSIEHCRLRGIPESWIDEMEDVFESGFRSETQTIYKNQSVTNHFRGVRDVDLAMRLGTLLGIDADRATATAFSRRAMVSAIKSALADGD